MQIDCDSGAALLKLRSKLQEEIYHSTLLIQKSLWCPRAAQSCPLWGGVGLAEGEVN